MKEALLYERLSNQAVKCHLCNQFCTVGVGRRGLCGVRENQQGRLISLNYGKIIAANIDPVEKKPLFHFLPGSSTYSIATVGCNLSCAHCQNADISQASKEGLFFEKNIIPGNNMTASEVVAAAIDSGCKSISYTYTEPTIFFEFAFDCMVLAREKGLKNIWVSNGYTSQEALVKVKPHLDAVNIDLKFFQDKVYRKICHARLNPVLENLRWYKNEGIWLEVTTLVIPTLNDSEKELEQIAQFIKKELGVTIPWHVSAFYPTYKLLDLPSTPIGTIRKAWEIGKEVGLHYVYGGNILSPDLENTYCPKCQEVVIRRVGYDVTRLDRSGQCQKCGKKLTLTLI